MNDIKVKRVKNKEKPDENEKELIRLRKEREYSEVEMKEKLKGMSISKIESNDMIRPKEMKIEEQLDAVRSLKNKQSCLDNEISEMRIVMDNKIAGLEEEQAKNDIRDSTIEELIEKVCRITEEKMKMRSESDRSIEDL